MKEALIAMRLAEQFLEREGSEAEILAMTGQMERAGALVAAHPLGRGGGLFGIEPAHFDAVMMRGDVA